jgi:two-component system, NarL family, response regulator DevR
LLRAQLCDLLVRSGVRVVAAVGTRLEGEAAIFEHRPDVAIIDTRLPDGRGVDLIRDLARTTPRVTFLLHSRISTDEGAIEALQAGASAVIAKSIRGDSLIEAVRNRADSSRFYPSWLGPRREDNGRVRASERRTPCRYN